MYIILTLAHTHIHTATPPTRFLSARAQEQASTQHHPFIHRSPPPAAAATTTVPPYPTATAATAR
jgi:hypothetical protein